MWSQIRGKTALIAHKITLKKCKKRKKKKIEKK